VLQAGESSGMATWNERIWVQGIPESVTDRPWCA